MRSKDQDDRFFIVCDQGNGTNAYGAQYGQRYLAFEFSAVCKDFLPQEGPIRPIKS